MPVGQLDGGHGTFAVFGKRVHHLTGRAAFVSMAVLSLLGFIWYGSPSGFLYTVLLGVMLKVRHPEPGTMEPLGTKRMVVAVITLVVFALCFWPFPITPGELEPNHEMSMYWDSPWFFDCVRQMENDHEMPRNSTKHLS